MSNVIYDKRLAWNETRGLANALTEAMDGLYALYEKDPYALFPLLELLRMERDCLGALVSDVVWKLETINELNGKMGRRS